MGEVGSTLVVEKTPSWGKFFQKAFPTDQPTHLDQKQSKKTSNGDEGQSITSRSKTEKGDPLTTNDNTSP